MTARRSNDRLTPARSEARYPTLREAASDPDRRTVLAGLGAALVATGLGACDQFGKEEGVPADGHPYPDGATGGVPDARLPPDADYVATDGVPTPDARVDAGPLDAPLPDGAAGDAGGDAGGDAPPALPDGGEPDGAP